MRRWMISLMNFGTPEEYENQLYENESDHEVEENKATYENFGKSF